MGRDNEEYISVIQVRRNSLSGNSALRKKHAEQAPVFSYLHFKLIVKVKVTIIHSMQISYCNIFK